MNWRSWLKPGAISRTVYSSESKTTDTFADTILLELKTVTTDAILKSITEREPRYMRSILDDSFFSVDSLIIKPLDASIYREVEEFFANHEAVAPDFRARFFAQIIQPEYRSRRGGVAKVLADLIPVFEFTPSQLEDETQDESFILSLKGRRNRFEVFATLRGPIAKGGQLPERNVSRAQGAAEEASDEEPILHTRKLRTYHAKITCKDKRGTTEKILALPIIIGREVTRFGSIGERSAFDVQGKFISRHQITIFELLGTIYYFIPPTASLTVTNQDGVLLKNHLYMLQAGESHTLQCGVEPNEAKIAAVRSDNHHYPELTIQAIVPELSSHRETPRPTAI